MDKNKGEEVGVVEKPLDHAKELVDVALSVLLKEVQVDVDVEKLAVAELGREAGQVLPVLANRGVIADRDVHLRSPVRVDDGEQLEIALTVLHRETGREEGEPWRIL